MALFEYIFVGAGGIVNGAAVVIASYEKCVRLQLSILFLVLSELIEDRINENYHH